MKKYTLPQLKKFYNFFEKLENNAYLETFDKEIPGVGKMVTVLFVHVPLISREDGIFLLEDIKLEIDDQYMVYNDSNVQKFIDSNATVKYSEQFTKKIEQYIFFKYEKEWSSIFNMWISDIGSTEPDLPFPLYNNDKLISFSEFSKLMSESYNIDPKSVVNIPLTEKLNFVYCKGQKHVKIGKEIIPIDKLNKIIPYIKSDPIQEETPKKRGRKKKND